MLPEQRATSYANDPSKATVVVVTEPSRPGLSGEIAAKLLLDAGSHLVGIDLAPGTRDRLIVMLGPHEQVATTRDVSVRVEGGGRTLTLQGAAAKLVASGASPYVF